MNATRDSNLSIVDLWLQSDEFAFIDAANVYALPVLVLSGSVGNMAAAATMRRVGAGSSRIYLLAYLALQTGVLYGGAGVTGVARVTRTPHFANTADWCCRLWQFAFSVAVHGATWVAVVAAADGAAGAWRHRRGRAVGRTPFCAKTTLVCALVGVVVVSVHALWTYELTAAGCYVPVHPADLQRAVWPWAAATLHQYVPLALLAPCVAVLVATPRPPPPLPAHTPLLRPVLAVSACHLAVLASLVAVNLVDNLRPAAMLRPRAFVGFLFARELTHLAANVHCGATYILCFATTPGMRREAATSLGGCAAHKEATQGPGDEVENSILMTTL